VARVRVGEGDWFAIPLDNGMFAVGLAARIKGNILFGYFFGPPTLVPVKLTDVAHLAPEDAILVGRFGILRLRNGTWPILGKMDDWDRTAWPMPALVNYQELLDRTVRRIYDDRDPGELLREEMILPGESTDGPEDGLMGARYVELVLNKRFGIPRRDEK
jgi:hypothetical protein